MESNYESIPIVEYVYAFFYCPCIHESSHATISLHRSKEGAETAMDLHKNAKRVEHDEMYINLGIASDSELYCEFGYGEDWSVGKIQIFE